jgi:hypothetical protein
VRVLAPHLVCGEVSNDIPWRQGDIFLESAEESELDIRLGMILTADCDIAQSKFGGTLAYVPIHSLRKFVLTDWALGKIASARENKLREIQAYVNKRRSGLNSAATVMSTDAIERWFVGNPAAQIAAELGLSDPKEIGKFESNHHPSVLLLAPESAARFSFPFSRLCALRDQMHGKTYEQVVEEVAKELQSEMSMDLFFLPRLPNFESMKGFVAYLRHVHAVNVSDLTFSLAEYRAQQGKRMRIGRLVDRYKFAITQQFGQLYSRIAKAPGYEDHQRDIVNALCSDLTKSNRSGQC